MRAAYYVGMTIEHGEGVQADPAEAARYYGLAARAGHAEAANALAVMLIEGRRLARDAAEAWAWFELPPPGDTTRVLVHRWYRPGRSPRSTSYALAEA